MPTCGLMFRYGSIVGADALSAYAFMQDDLLTAKVFAIVGLLVSIELLVLSFTDPDRKRNERITKVFD